MKRFVQGSARHPAGRGADGGAQAVEGGEPELVPFTLASNAGRGREPAVLERDLAQRVRVGHEERPHEAEPLRIGREEEGGDPRHALARVCDREQEIEVRDPGVRDEGLHAVEDVVVPVPDGGRAHGGHVGPRLRLAHREGRHGPPPDGAVEPQPPLPLVAGQRDRGRAQRLEGEHRVRER